MTNKNQLFYRGRSYETIVPVWDGVERELTGNYRGVNWQIAYPRHMEIPQQTIQGKYRGIDYSHGKDSVAPVKTQEIPNLRYSQGTIEEAIAHSNPPSKLKLPADRVINFQA